MSERPGSLRRRESSWRSKQGQTHVSSCPVKPSISAVLLSGNLLGLLHTVVPHHNMSALRSLSFRTGECASPTSARASSQRWREGNAPLSHTEHSGRSTAGQGESWIIVFVYVVCSLGYVWYRNEWEEKEQGRRGTLQATDGQRGQKLIRGWSRQTIEFYSADLMSLSLQTSRGCIEALFSRGKQLVSMYI